VLVPTPSAELDIGDSVLPFEEVHDQLRDLAAPFALDHILRHPEGVGSFAMQLEQQLSRQVLTLSCDTSKFR
jgi:hypothetical protein